MNRGPSDCCGGARSCGKLIGQEPQEMSGSLKIDSRSSAGVSKDLLKFLFVIRERSDRRLRCLVDLRPGRRCDGPVSIDVRWNDFVNTAPTRHLQEEGNTPFEFHYGHS
jgi:hypothetical protein